MAKAKKITAASITKAMEVNHNNNETLTIGEGESKIDIIVKKKLTLFERADMVNSIVSMVWTQDDNGNETFAPYLRKFAYDFNILNYFTNIQLPDNTDKVWDLVDNTDIAYMVIECVGDGYIENICLYRSLCKQIPVRNRMLLHCAVLQFNGNGYAFLGRSGTGKSTHTRLWKRYLGTPQMINGDKPVLQHRENGFIAYGTPWKGKEGWGMRASAPLCGLCFLEQAKVNSIRKLSPAEAASRLFTQILLPEDEENVVSTLDMADKLVTMTPCYVLQCDISKEAVKTSFEALTGLPFEQFEKKE